MMTQEKRPLGFKENIDKLLFILATGYLIAVVIWFLTPVKPKNTLSTNNISTTKTIVEENLSKEKDGPSVSNSIPREAENIEVKTKSNPISATIINKPTVSIADLKPKENNLIPPQSLPVLPISSLPPISAPSSPSPSPAAINNSSSLLQPLKVPIPPPPQKSSTAKLTSLPVLNSSKNDISYRTETPLPSPSSNENENVQPTPPQAILNYSLVGLVKLEDQSDLALFKINNSTQRVKIGEEIGSSGWILMAINEKQAVINQFGQSVRLTIGDKF